MQHERILYSVLGLEGSERRSLDPVEHARLEARVAAALRAVGFRWFVRLLFVLVPTAAVAWAKDQSSRGSFDGASVFVPSILGATCFALMLFETAEVRSPRTRRVLYALTFLGPVGVGFGQLGILESLAVALPALWVFGFLFAFMAFAGRCIEDVWLLRALIPLALMRDARLLRAAGIVTMDPVPRRFRELGVVAGRHHELEVLEGSFAIVSIDGASVDGFPHVPIARVHIVDRADETSVGAEGDLRVTERRLTDGELHELRRIRSRAMMRSYALAVPTLWAILHAMHAVEAMERLAHFCGLTSYAGGYAGLVGFPLLAVSGLAVQLFAYLRFGRDLFARRVRIERSTGQRIGAPSLRETLWHSGRPWTERGAPDRERWIPYD